MWEIRKRVVGGKKAEQIATVSLDPKTGKLIVSRNKIKEVSLEYYKNTLPSHEPHAEYAKEINAKKNEVEKKLLENDGEFNINRETFYFIVSKFKKSRKRNYDFLVKAGKGFQSAVFRFFQVMIEEETFPKSFQETTLHMIFKGGKGRRENLTENRFIHSISWLQRTAKAMLVEEGLKESLVEGSSMNQVGGQPGHRAQEHVFVLKSIIAKYREEGKLLIIQSSDLSKFFDKEMIEDAFLTCMRREPTKKQANYGSN